MEFQGFVDYVRGWREQTQGDEPVAPVVAFMRADELLCIVHVGEVDRDAALHVAEAGVGGFGADVVYASFDASGTTLTENPVTGKAWAPREMQEVRKLPQYADQFRDVVMIHGAWRDGRAEAIEAPYRPNPEGVEWLDSDPPERITGRLVDALAATFQRKTLADLMGEIPGVEPPPDARSIMDRTIVEFITSKGHAVLVNRDAIDGEWRPGVDVRPITPDPEPTL